MSQWLGGIGIVVLFVAVAPTLGCGVVRLLGAEVSGVIETRFTPRIADTAKVLLVIYLAPAWVMVFVLATLLVAIQEDVTPSSSATAVAATLNVVGPGLGQVGASESYEPVTAFGRFVLTLCMLFGRLEIFTALALFSPAFWRIVRRFPS